MADSKSDAKVEVVNVDASPEKTKKGGLVIKAAEKKGEKSKTLVVHVDNILNSQTGRRYGCGEYDASDPWLMKLCKDGATFRGQKMVTLKSDG